jgi:hypothetical protein
LKKTISHTGFISSWGLYGTSTAIHGIQGIIGKAHVFENIFTICKGKASTGTEQVSTQNTTMIDPLPIIL